jgi:hypothetical protein
VGKAVRLNVINTSHLYAVGEAVSRFSLTLESMIPKLQELTKQVDISITRMLPNRRDDESLVDWGNRLERAGLLDKYEYRLMYGEECWRAVLHSPVWAMKKALDYIRGIDENSTEGA